MHKFLRVAETNKKQNDFISYPCIVCQNMKDYSSTKTLHFYMLQSGFMAGYNCWTKHEEIRDIMEDNEEEEDNDNYTMFTEHGGTTMGEDEAEKEHIIDEPDADVRRAILEAKINCGSDNERLKLETMLQEHNKLL